MSENHDANHESENLTQYRLKQIEESLQKVAANLERLTTLESKHVSTREGLVRAFKAIEDVEERVHTIEVELPTLKLIRVWVIGGVVGMVGLLGATLIRLAMIHPGIH